jgi:hypothetical protein
MKQVVIMPGGFHPFHAGHYALYQQAVKAFPGADVYVAATADTSTRPFPFQIKQKLAKLAGVPADRFVQVKSPFSAQEITAAYNPEDTALIFVRSEKDRNTVPQPAKRDAQGNLPLVTRGSRKGQPVSDYLQFYTGPENLEPMSKHAYMAYLPTVEFGPGMTSATQIRTAWPGLNDKRKTALVMSLYPQTQTNPKLAATVVKLLDAAIGTQEVAEGNDDVWGPQGRFAGDVKVDLGTASIKPIAIGDLVTYFGEPAEVDAFSQDKKVARITFKNRLLTQNVKTADLKRLSQGMEENQGWAATYETNTQNFVGGMKAGYQARENQPVDEDYIEEKWSQKYKSSINCANPKGFSQRAHCAGRKK